MDLDLRIDDREVFRAFERLTSIGRAKVLGEAVTEASEPIVRDAQGRAPSRVIASGIRLINVIAKGGGVTAEIGLPGGRKPWFHGLFVERGTGPRVRKSGGRTGSMPAKPFLRPAFDAQRRSAEQTFAASIRRRLMEIRRG